jgi:hypothetical protein
VAPAFSASRRQLRQLEAGDPELRVPPPRDHLLVVPLPPPRIHPDHDLAPGKEIPPVEEGMQGVEGDPDPPFQRPGILLPGGEVGGEDHLSRIQIGEQGEHPVQLPFRHTLQPRPGGPDPAEDVGMGIGFHGVEHPGQGTERPQAVQLPIHRLQVVDVGCGRLGRDGQELVLLPLPPAERRGRGAAVLLPELLPGGTEHMGRAVFGDELGVELTHQLLGLILLHHHSEVQVAGRLGHQVDPLLLEGLHGRSQLVEERPDPVPHQAHRGTRAHHGGPAEGGELREERLQHPLVQEVGHRIQ